MVKVIEVPTAESASQRPLTAMYGRVAHLRFQVGYSLTENLSYSLPRIEPQSHRSSRQWANVQRYGL